MTQILLIGIGAGAATALLFASVASGSAISILLFYLAPLPILIAALGWSHWAALIAAFAAALALAAIFGGFFFLSYLIGIGLPAWWLGYLTLLARPATAPTPDGLEWYPIGHVVFWAAVISALIVIAAILAFVSDADEFRTALRSGLERVLRVQSRAPAPLPGQLPGQVRLPEPGRVIDFLVVALPPAVAVLTSITNLLNLWLAGLIVKTSGRLRRPPPELAGMRFPAYAPALLAAAVAGSFLPGLFGIAAGVLTASLLTAYAILGFAVLHAITRPMNSRPFVLAGVYAAVFVLGWPVLAVALLGLADAAFDFRGRVAGRPGPPQIRS
jgi:hypothetical protein